MELVELDALEAQPSQAARAGLAQMLRPAVGMPLVRAAARQATLGGDDEIVRVGVQGFGDQPLRDLGALCVRRVDQVDVQIDRGP